MIGAYKLTFWRVQLFFEGLQHRCRERVATLPDVHQLLDLLLYNKRCM